MATSVQPRASERVVVLLRPKEKQKLVRIARREKVSAGEILRRSLSTYLTSAPDTESEIFTQIGAALDQMHATLQVTNQRIDARIQESERLLQDPAHAKRLAQLDAFIARHGEPARARKQRTKAA